MTLRSCPLTASLLATTALAAGCASTAPATAPALPNLPVTGEFCLAAERVITRTVIPMQVVVHPDVEGFVKSKALIEGPTIQQYDWPGQDGRLLGISCKLKNADHLIAAYGPGSAGPDGTCQDMNRAVYALVAREVRRPVFPDVRFDDAETVTNDKMPTMTGPDWMAPFTLTSVDPDGALRIATKGFIVNFDDPRFAQMPVRFRGVHYCHLIAPEHLRDLLAGRARPGAVIGQAIVNADPNAMRQ